MIKIKSKKYTLYDNSGKGLFPLMISKSLPKILVRAYGLHNFLINHNHFAFSPDWFNEDIQDLMYDSCFYTFVSMILTRSERDIFIKLFRKGV